MEGCGEALNRISSWTGRAALVLLLLLSVLIHSIDPQPAALPYRA
jgi:hypothetical protein